MTSGGVCISANSDGSASEPAMRDDDAKHEREHESRRRRVAPLRSRVLRRNDAPRPPSSPTPTISASEMIIQIQKSDVDTAASPAEPMRVPTQNASTDENSVINSDDATAGSATRRIVRAQRVGDEMRRLRSRR